MRLRITCAAAWGVLSAVCAGEPRNLVRNGDFEAGKSRPAGWTRPDKLTVFWTEGGVAGKCLRFDTDVYRSEWEAHGGDSGTATTKTPTSGKKYDTVAGSVGVNSWSDPIDVVPGRWYVIRADVKGPGGSEPFVFLKGYRRLDAREAGRHGTLRFFKPRRGGASYSVVVGGDEKREPGEGDYLQVYRARLVCRIPKGETGWRRHERAIRIRPKGNAKAEKVLLMLYAYWPPGDYRFDNVELTPVSADEAAQVKRRKTTNYGTRVGD